MKYIGQYRTPIQTTLAATFSFTFGDFGDSDEGVLNGVENRLFVRSKLYIHCLTSTFGNR